MNKITLILIGLLFYACTAFGQNQTDSIYTKKILGTDFFQNGKLLRPNQLLKITKINPEAYKEMKKAKSNFIVATILSSAGGGFVGYPLGTAIGGGDPNWKLAGIGVGLIIVSIPVTLSYTKHAKNAVGIYNNGLSSATSFRRIDFNFGLTGNGLGIVMRF